MIQRRQIISLSAEYEFMSKEKYSLCRKTAQPEVLRSWDPAEYF